MDHFDLKYAKLYYDPIQKEFCIEDAYEPVILKKCKKFDTFKKIIGDRIYDVNLFLH